VSGNVSLYNETDGAAIPPTPAVGGLGLLADAARHADYAHVRAGDLLFVAGVSRGELGASLYLRECLGRDDGAPPPVDLAAERRTGDFVRGLIAERLVSGVHDLSDGGVAVAAAEMALASNVGVVLEPTSASHAHAFLFGEDQARYLIATRNSESVVAAALDARVNLAPVGRAGGRSFESGGLFSIPLSQLRGANEEWLPRWMAGELAPQA
ncbi:MAG TPA: AIR synthase-related protein, partial [Caulobacteraceae bacterium]|nr:AIR synthase-related protein [Caulobacteraceae bacterium]